MWREMRRKKQELPQDECTQILRAAKRGFLAVHGEEGYPYVAPTDYAYNEEDGCLYFHSAVQGHRIDAMKANQLVSFSVIDEGEKENEDDWWYFYRSVVIFGHVEFIDDVSEKDKALRALSAKFTDDQAYIQDEIDRNMPRTLIYRLVPDHMTGKRVREK